MKLFRKKKKPVQKKMVNKQVIDVIKLIDKQQGKIEKPKTVPPIRPRKPTKAERVDKRKTARLRRKLEKKKKILVQQYDNEFIVQVDNKTDNKEYMESKKNVKK